MIKNKKKIILILTSFTIIGIIILGIIFKTDNVEALSKYGSRGSEVTQIQTKLTKHKKR